ncbi:phosphotransferase [Clostridium sp. AL.422]|uniref:aminoglycoside phosphotransferase family protein n=1 Tax=Clostridium TaxID=1485 RepID=UPI00293DDF73|nr:MULTISPECIES: phosphotransferase [unclassified Clostridium]MDV4151924.1 phosphotransferase [Clostridium sp. AL.422]
MFYGIEESEKWSKIDKINKGWSNDIKYYIETEDNQKLVLRISSIDKYEEKKKEYEVICKYSKLGFEMSKPISFGICNNEKNTYILLSWVEGEDLEVALPKLEEIEQYRLGKEAGSILRKIHNIKVPTDKIPRGTKIPRKKEQIQRYINSKVRIPEDEVALDFINNNINKIWSTAPVYQHGDFHPGNLILTPDKKIGVIDFNRWEIGDPYEEFYKLESFGTEVSIPYCIGEIHGYFNGEVPDKFWDILAVYVAHASLFSIKWAEKFGQSDVEHMIKICKKSFKHYDNFNRRIPSWYIDYEKNK